MTDKAQPASGDDEIPIERVKLAVAKNMMGMRVTLAGGNIAIVHRYGRLGADGCVQVYGRLEADQ
jgi:hypothetical protein